VMATRTFDEGWSRTGARRPSGLAVLGSGRQGCGGRCGR
jgi:hypothetical protein